PVHSFRCGLVEKPNAAPEEVLGIESCIALDLFNAIYMYSARQPVVKFLTAAHLRGTDLIAARPHVPVFRRVNTYVDVFREPIDDLKALGKRCSSLQLKRHAQF